MKYHKTLSKSVETLSAHQLQKLFELPQGIPEQPLMVTEPSAVEMPDSKLIYFLRNLRTSWPTTRANQIVNILYFGSWAAYFLWQSNHSGGLFLSAGALAFSLITALSCLFLLKHRSFVSAKSEMPALTRNLLRVFALSLPIVMLCGLSVIHTNDALHNNHNISSLRYQNFELEPAISLSPKDRENLTREIEIADQLLAKRENLKAIVHYENALDIYPRSPHALVKAAECYLLVYQNAQEKTIEYATQALNLDPNDTDALFYLALAYNDLKDYERALPIAETLTSREPGFGRGWETLCTAKLGLGLFEGALIAANEHVRLHPNELVALYERAQVLKAMGHTKEAQDRLERLKTP